MATKTLSTRIQLKNDTLVNWNKATFVPLAGELLIYKDTGKLKVGDGTKTVGNLDYLYESISNTEIDAIFA